GTIQDITKRKQAEEALKQLNEELENRVRERTEELLNVTFEVEERERNRFALELHDDLGPILSSVKLYFQWLAETDIPEKKKIITEKGNISIDRAIQTTREISHGLGSQVVKNIGFSAAVQNFVQNINDTQKLYIDFKFNTYKRFGNFLEITLYRITTELINNTLKYANATRVEIDFEYSREKSIILFKYFENGVGFDFEAVEKTKSGHGLMNIKNRINLIRGEIKIETGVGKGLYVYIILPVDDEMDSDTYKN
ncbi:MAG TPA: ATP-binding protein, partial [Draconibacterium sp.]|nr:ATP-binding protein [Draconibacterium sp.]